MIYCTCNENKIIAGNENLLTLLCKVCLGISSYSELDQEVGHIVQGITSLFKPSENVMFYKARLGISSYSELEPEVWSCSTMHSLVYLVIQSRIKRFGHIVRGISSYLKKEIMSCFKSLNQRLDHSVQSMPLHIGLFGAGSRGLVILYDAYPVI